MSDTTGKSLFQQELIDALGQRLDQVDTSLNLKLDKYVYEAKKAVLENNDLRHDADIAYLETNTVDKTVYNAKMTNLDNKDFEQDNRIKTLEGLLPSKVDKTVFDQAIVNLTAVDSDHEARIYSLEQRANGFDSQISNTINVAIGQKIDETVALNVISQLNDNSSDLYQDLQSRVTKAANDAINAQQDAVIALKADKTYVDDKVSTLNTKNLTWERRLNAVDQYIRLMLETYEIKLPGNPNAWEYTAAFDAALAMNKYHFKVAARKPRGEFVVEMEPFAYNTFYGKLEMTLNSGFTTSITKPAFGVSPVAPYRTVISLGISRELNTQDFPVTFKLYDSSGTQEGVIKTINIQNADYSALPIMDAPRFSYSSSEYTLVKAYSGYTDATINNLSFTLETGSSPANSWSVVGDLPAGVTFANGVFTGGPSTSATLGDYSVVVKAANASGENGFHITFKVIDRPAVVYNVSTHSLLKNIQMTDIVPTLSGLTTHGALAVSASGLVSGMFIDATTGRIYGAPKAAVSNQNVTVTVTGKNGSSNTAVLNFTVSENAPDISYSNVGSVGNPLIFRLNNLIDAINVNMMATSGSITSLTISPALPTGLTFTDKDSNNVWIGRIAGTPTASIGETKYTVTATGPGGVDTADVYLSVLPAIPVISYSQSSYEFTRDVAITSVTPTSSGSPTEYTLYNLNSTNPGTLPTGLTFNTTTGVISGTPTVEQASTGYSVRATGAGGASAPVSFYVTVKKPVPVIAYASGLNSFLRNSTITAFGPTTATNQPTLYTIDKVLPAGLNFNNATGEVSGKPLVLSSETTYNVVAYNEGGASDDASFNLRVIEDEPVIAYASADLNKTFTRGVAITPFAPSSTQNHISSFSAPLLPAGLSISSTGVISGTPTSRTFSGVVAVEVTATGNGGDSAPVTINIEVNEPAPVFSYGNSTYVRLVDAVVSIAPISQVVNQVNSWSAVDLPAGLSVNTSGSIVGTPTQVGGPVTATVTAVGPDFSTSRTIVLDIDQEIPATNVQNGVLESGANFELKLWSNPNSNTDEVFVKKLTSGDVTADLVYYTTDSNGVVSMTSIESKNFISGDFVRISVDRNTEYGTDNRLAVVDNLGVAGEVVLAKFVVVPAELYVPPVPSNNIQIISGDPTQFSGSGNAGPVTFKFTSATGASAAYLETFNFGSYDKYTNNGDVRIGTADGPVFWGTPVTAGQEYILVVINNWNPFYSKVRVVDQSGNPITNELIKNW